MIVFIILHYKTIDETLECLKAIKKLNKQNKINIVIVSNDKLSNKEKLIFSEYTQDIIVNKNNIGFAKANNIGCKYAIDKYHPDYLAVINNDVIIKQKKFVEMIESAYRNFNFDILGPKINSPSGESVNPFPALQDKDEIRQEIKKNIKIIKIYQSKLLTCLFNIYHYIKYIFIKKRELKNGDCIEQGVALHGCALIFSKKYYEKYPEVFYNDTFLYHEEEFLYFRMKFNNLCTVYFPEIVIFHKEGASLNKHFNGENIKKKIFRYEEQNKSLKKLLKYIESEE